MDEVTPEYVTLLPDYTSFTISYSSYQAALIGLVVLLLIAIIIIGICGWVASVNYQVLVYDPHETAKKVRERVRKRRGTTTPNPTPTIPATPIDVPTTEQEEEVCAPDMSQQVVLYNGVLPDEWWKSEWGRHFEYASIPLDECCHIRFRIEGTINPFSHDLVFRDRPFKAREGYRALQEYRAGHRLTSDWAINPPTFDRVGAWCSAYRR